MSSKIFGRLRWLLLAILPLTAYADPIPLTEGWRFQAGDDPAWAAAGFDDAGWEPRVMPDPWTGAGHPETRQTGWYRLRIDASRLHRFELPAIRLGFVRNAYEVYVDGVHLGGVGRLPPDPLTTHDRVRILPLPAGAGGGDLVIALRVWAGSDLSVRRTGAGPYAGEVLLGDYPALLSDFYLEQAPLLIFAASFLMWGLYFLYLFTRTPTIRSFLWFGLTAIVLATYLLTQSQAKYALGLPFSTLEKLESSVFFVFLALMIEVTWSVLEQPATRLLRAFQAYFLLLPVLLAVFPGLDIFYHLRPYWHLGSVLSAVPIFYAIIRAVRAGNRDARTLIYGLLLFAATAFHHLLVTHQFVPGPGFVPFGFFAVAASMAVILADRFSSLVHDLEAQVGQRTAELEDVNELLSRANRKLERISRLDPLTGLLNRRAFEAAAETERQRFERHATPLSVLLADIDHFKAFNDQYGHDCGDRVLKDVAALLRQHTRDIDHVARWGGEEFVLLLPGTNLEGALRIGERIRRQVEDYGAEYGGRQLDVTLTIGAAAYRNGETLEACVARADAALYRGKRAGRNRVEAQDPLGMGMTATR